MGEVLKFDFSKPSQDFEINGKIYTVYYDDASIKKYSKKAKEFNKAANDIAQYDLEQVTEEEEMEIERKAKDVVKDVLETLFGEGSFDKLYQESGESMHNMVELIVFIYQWLEEHVSSKNKLGVRNIEHIKN